MCGAARPERKGVGILSPWYRGGTADKWVRPFPSLDLFNIKNIIPITLSLLLLLFLTKHNIQEVSKSELTGCARGSHFYALMQKQMRMSDD